MPTPLRVLILDDSPTDAEVMAYHLQEAGYAPTWQRVETEADYLANLEPSLDLILIDYTLPDFNGRRALELLQGRGWDIPAIIVTGTVSEETALECVRLGAADYLLKDRLARLGAAVQSALAQRTLRQERAAAEAARQASQDRARFLADVLEKSSQPFAVGYPNGRLGMCNAALCSLLGYTEGELQALNWSQDLTPPEWRAFEETYQTELHRAGFPVRYEKEYLRKDGSRVPVELLVHLVRDAAGAPLYYYAFVTDLSDRLRAEQDLAARTRQLEAVRAVSEELTRELDSTRLLQLISRRAADLVGYGSVLVFLWEETARVLVPKAWSGAGDFPPGAQHPLRLGEGLVGQVAQRREGMIIDAYSTGPFARVEDLAHTPVSMGLAEPLLYRDRLVGVLLLDNRDTGRPFAAQDQAVLRLFAPQAAIAIENARLFAEVGQAYQNLQKAHDALMRTENFRTLGQLAASIAHELSSRLAIILGQAEHLQPRATDPAIRDALTSLEVAASEGAQMIRRLQEFARQRTQSALAVVDLAPVVHEALEITRPRLLGDAQRQRVRIQVHTDLEGIPPILGNVQEIREALINLFLNAIEAMPDGGTLTVRASRTPAGVALTVTDTGLGMSEAIRQRIFEPFFSTKGVHGTGLGLSVVYGIMDRHGGTVEVASMPGRGTTVTLRFQAA